MSRLPLPATAGELPLFAWGRRHAPQPRRPSGIRLLLLENCRNADGEARPALVVPGHRLPMIYPTIATALAAKASLEAGR